ncbi:hypothetical protein KQX54_015294 [Cotesia glomerata]|uniref:Transmembrane protein n=1 Tax=Cotesia glomerata TaxID=32391 RepID=A0AAV7HY04_COTGL|nr:hypothetical protein KQX54_015294 [Cotesia glomerata]
MISRKPARSKYVAVLNRGKREKRGENVPRRVEVCVACTKGQTDRDKEHFRTKARGESKVLLVLVYLSLLALALTPFVFSQKENARTCADARGYISHDDGHRRTGGRPVYVDKVWTRVLNVWVHLSEQASESKYRVECRRCLTWVPLVFPATRVPQMGETSGQLTSE